jgi:phospholipid/cholesterol/gamma-HCH transport system substrate-binding protein
MENTTQRYKVRLGIFIVTGIALFLVAIFLIGRQKNLFNPVFTIKTEFQNVSGLQVGSTVRYAGINVGTVDLIEIMNDSIVSVEMSIQQDVKKFIHADSKANIGSEGIIGDKIIVISQGTSKSPRIKSNQTIAAIEPVETDAIMRSLEITADNAAIATEEISEILIGVNNGKGTLGKMLKDDSMAENIDKTITNLKQGTKKLDENMEAAKSNFLLRGYFKKKKREERKRKKRSKAEKKKNSPIFFTSK